MFWPGVAAALLAGSVAAAPSPRTLFGKDPTCLKIENSVSVDSLVSYFGSPAYIADNAHATSSSSQISACSVEPGSVQDVSTILTILANTTTPFAVKGGGHAQNPGFSSTTGVQIAMSRFSQVTYHASSNTADIGTGLIWDDVYAVLGPLGVNVVGGRVSGVGVAGFSLGGGFSWLTNLHGLTVDTIQGFEVVLPSGQVVYPTANNLPDLFFGLKGGQNNFGIVTRITLTTYPQGQVWGGSLLYAGTALDALTAATADFAANNTDPNANIIFSYNTLAGLAVPSLILFYNAPEPPIGLWDKFLAIPYLSKDVKARGFLDFVASAPANATNGMRGRYNSVSLAKLTPTILDFIKGQSTLYGLGTLTGVGLFTSYDVEPFLPTAYAHATPSAWPHSKYLSPLNLYFAWPLELPLGLSDGTLVSYIKKSGDNIRAAAIAEGQDLSGLATYTNYALGSATLQEVFGDNVAQLKVIKAKYDPHDVMGRAGGFKF